MSFFEAQLYAETYITPGLAAVIFINRLVSFQRFSPNEIRLSTKS